MSDLDAENLDLWSGYNLSPTNAVDIGKAIVRTHVRYCDGLEWRSTGPIRQSARWLRSIADAMENLADEAEKEES